jgi:hypothetical protein
MSKRLLARRLATLAVGVLGSVSVLFGVTASPAMAGPSGKCARGVACFWSNSGYTGTLETILGSWGSGHCHNFQYVNNAISSLDNSSGKQIRVYQNANCTGIWYKNFPDTYGQSDFAYTGYNDTFSSVMIL